MDQFDVVIVGAGPAGSTAAHYIASQGHSVALLDAAAFPRKKPCAGWLNAKATDLIKEMGVRQSDVITGKIDELIFCNKDLTQSASPKLDGPAALLVDRVEFDQRLVEACQKAGVEFRDRHLVTGVQALEQTVEVKIRDREAVAGRLLLIATGLSRSLLNPLGIQLPKESRSAWSAHVEAPRESSTKVRKAKAVVVLGATRDSGACIAIEQADRVSVTLNSGGDSKTLSHRLVELAGAMAKEGFISQDLSGNPDGVRCIPTIPSSALEMDSHVGKHTLVIGDAGGFYAAVSNEGIFPAMWSARIAAEIAAEALATPITQDVLMRFDTRWRLDMGEFLRPPNTDMQLLIPLVFTNQPMADRMAAAFFTGENI